MRNLSQQYYLWIFVHQNGNDTAFTSLRAAYEDTNSNATSCLIISQHFHNQRAVFYGSPDRSGRRSPTTQRIHRTYGGAPAISCASASHAPKRYTTSPALWRAQCSLDLCSPFAYPSLDLRSRQQPPLDTILACFPFFSDGIIKQKHLSWR